MSDLIRTLASGAAATGVITLLLAAANGLGLLRLNFGRLLGTLILPDGRAARVIGWALHFLNGAAFALGYRALFWWTGRQPAPETGAAAGAGHALLALGVLAVLGRLHPRRRAAGVRPLTAGAYGPLTLPGMVVGHIIYGAIVAWLLSLPSGRTDRSAGNGG